MKFTSGPNWVPLEVDDDPVLFDAAAPEAPPPPAVAEAAAKCVSLSLLGMGAPNKYDPLGVVGSSAEPVSKPVTPHKFFNCPSLLSNIKDGPHSRCLTSRP